MTFDEIRRAVTARMVAWNGIPSGDIDYPNDGRGLFRSEGKDLWARFNVISGITGTPEIGSRPYVMRTGMVVVQLFVPIQTDITRITVAADGVRELFEFASVGGVEFEEASLIEVGDDGYGWYQINVRIFYTAR